VLSPSSSIALSAWRSLSRRRLRAAEAVSYAGELCHGVRVLVTDRDTLDAPELGLEIASALHRLYPENFQLEKMKTLLENQAVLMS